MKKASCIPSDKKLTHNDITSYDVQNCFDGNSNRMIHLPNGAAPHSLRKLLLLYSNPAGRGQHPHKAWKLLRRKFYLPREKGKWLNSPLVFLDEDEANCLIPLARGVDTVSNE